ncbi:LptF/LptG family permease [Hoylesella nanceiensis]|jgi:putative permease|uniref:LptF/LptG family permease n=1 Tax=Hoylesella nanceiensis TaxID=425941 RepID=UPI00036E72F2|nr:LptF/LptG family permease [Hoylesella nanceiensis]MBF1426392.1 YjgP/YjgQ family permease [Hoylesella nanceiensis]
MFRIKKLDIFIVKQFGMLFIGTFFICQFVLMMQFLWRYIDDLIGKGLTMDVLAQFFWYMGLMLVPQALPLAILLSSLITYGNLGESSELTAIKAAGISLMQSFRGLIVITIMIAFASFYFQNNIGPTANLKLAQLILSMRDKSPETQIPVGVFYDGIPNSNIYVQKKDNETGKLYGIMIYRMTGSYEDQAIILADSGMLQSTADRKHLLLSLWSGEWFENMQSQEFTNTAAVPYRRETFVDKKIIIPFDDGFNLTDASLLSGSAKSKSMGAIWHSLDSLNHYYDSVGNVNFKELSYLYNPVKVKTSRDSLRLETKRASLKQTFDVETDYSKLSSAQKQQAVSSAIANIQRDISELDYRSMLTVDGDVAIRFHWIEAYNKITLALSCLLFFFIGAPLGAIIRKGGLGIPIIVSVLVFITYYILDNSGYRMAREGIWAIWFGKTLAMMVLTPIAVFVTYKANNDSVVFNMDAYRVFFTKLLGLRLKRHLALKEVVIYPPHYEESKEKLRYLDGLFDDYLKRKKLLRLPNPIKVFFKYQDDHEIERLSEQLEEVVQDLANTRSSRIIAYLNQLPILSAKAHTRPFDRKRYNVLAAICFPLGIILYIRMWRFRLRLANDIKKLIVTNKLIVDEIDNIQQK